MEEKGASSNGTHKEYLDEEQEEEMLAQELESLVLQSNAYENENENDSSMIMIENKVDFGDEQEGNLQAYPLRPYAEDCSFFVKTGSCKFGHACRFNHPSYGGFQDQEKGSEMNDGTIADTSKIDCKYFRSPGGCRYGDACRYNHSVRKVASGSPELNFLGLPVRPSEQECAFYLRTGSCGYGANCRFNHPDPTAVKESEPKNSTTNVRGGNSYPKMYANEPFQSSGVTRGILETNVRGGNSYPKMYANEPFQSSGVSRGISDLSNGINLRNGLPYVTMNYYPQAMPQNAGWNQDQVNLPLSAKKTPLPHQIFNNSKKTDPPTHYEQVMQSEEFPLRPGQPDCDYFMKHGDCKYRAACRFNHPVSRTSKLHLPQVSSKDVHSKYKSHDLPSSNSVNTRKNGTPSYQQPQILNGTYPERPGQPECEFFMKTGDCKFKAACKYHHPKDRVSTPSSCALNEAGFPLRPGARICRNYEQQGTCKYGQSCLFHHPDNFSPEITDQVARDAREDEDYSSSNAVAPIALDSSSNNMGSDWGDGWVM